MGEGVCWGIGRRITRRRVCKSAAGIQLDFKDEGDVTVTTRDAAAARRRCLAVALAAVIGGAGLSLGGCGGNTFSLFQSATNNPPQDSQPQAATQSPVAKVAINSIVGPPDALGKQLHQEFSSALQKQRVGVASKDERADFNLRPYILAAKEKNGTKVSYVLDVSEPTGKRVNRFAGEEMVAASPSQDPWGAITPAVAEAIAAKATGSFAAWLPSTKSPAVAEAPQPPPGADAAKAEARPAGKKTVASIQTTTGSIGKDVTAVVPAVTGAPGDGGTSLTAAIQRELQTKGVSLTDRPSPAAYRVEGAVLLGSAREGKQPIQIEWVVRNPSGVKLGTVSQKNDIPEGSLDGSWGKVADQAASAAVQGILKLLPSGANAVN
ncbi:MAG TPA: hypothetical protein VG758_09635 [Hyphomicrobiaceae bacterium]|nr:hypothetical protein [Hyphomicrobiaceae bacterium]